MEEEEQESGDQSLVFVGDILLSSDRICNKPPPVMEKVVDAGWDGG